MITWQEEIVEASAGVMTRGEARDYEADAAFDLILEEAELAVNSAQTPALALAIEICKRVQAQKVWDSYYENWELDKLSDFARIRFPKKDRKDCKEYMLIGSEEIVDRYNVNKILNLGLENEFPGLTNSSEPHLMDAISDKASKLDVTDMITKASELAKERGAAIDILRDNRSSHEEGDWLFYLIEWVSVEVSDYPRSNYLLEENDFNYAACNRIVGAGGFGERPILVSAFQPKGEVIGKMAMVWEEESENGEIETCWDFEWSPETSKRIKPFVY